MSIPLIVSDLRWRALGVVNVLGVITAPIKGVDVMLSSR